MAAPHLRLTYPQGLSPGQAVSRLLLYGLRDIAVFGRTTQTNRRCGASMPIAGNQGMNGGDEVEREPNARHDAGTDADLSERVWMGVASDFTPFEFGDITAVRH
jgi:hypothetical protein